MNIVIDADGMIWVVKPEELKKLYTICPECGCEVHVDKMISPELCEWCAEADQVEDCERIDCGW